MGREKVLVWRSMKPALSLMASIWSLLNLKGGEDMVLVGVVGI